MAAPVKKYGLILNAKKAGPIGPAKKPSAFNDDASDEDTKKPSIKKESIGQSILKKQTQLEIDRALAEDPSVYEYDAVYDDLKAKQHEQKTTAAKDKADQKKPKYIAGLMKMAEMRKKEEERRIERGVQRERQAEGEAFADKEQFVTSAYRRKLIEMREAEEKERLEAELEAKLDVTNQRDLSGFYRHLYRQAAGEEERPPSSAATGDATVCLTTSGESTKPPNDLHGSGKPASDDQASAKSVKRTEGDSPPKDTDRNGTRDRHRKDRGHHRGDRPSSISPDRRSGSCDDRERQRSDDRERHRSDDRERQRDSRQAKASKHESRSESAARESTTRPTSSRHSSDRHVTADRRERDDSDERNRDRNVTRSGGRRSSGDRQQHRDKYSGDSSRRHTERSRRAKHRADSSSDSSIDDEHAKSRSRASDASIEPLVASERQRSKTGSDVTSRTPLEARVASRVPGNAISAAVHEAVATKSDRNRRASSGSSSSSSSSSSRPTSSLSRPAEVGATKASEAHAASDTNAEKTGSDDWVAKYARRHDNDSVDQARARYLARKAANAVVPVVSRSKDD